MTVKVVHTIGKNLKNYYNHFLPNVSTVFHPLHQLLEQDSEQQWTEQCEQAFTEAKHMIASEQVLTHYGPALPVTCRLACDASSTGIGAILSHVMPHGSERPVAFASRSLIKSQVCASMHRSTRKHCQLCGVLNGSMCTSMGSVSCS